jgi:predicted TIM-barrel fold metal-dependent hydrolase
MQVLQDELEQIKEIKHKFSKFSQSEHLIPEFLSISSTLNNNIERILSKPLPPTTNVDPWDLPHELQGIREALDQSKVLEEALRFK